MTKQTSKNFALALALLALTLTTSAGFAQARRGSKFPAGHPASAAAPAPSHPANTPAQSYTYTVFAYPGSLSTYACGINHGATTKAQIVGTAGTQGFLAALSEKKSTTEKYQPLNYPHVSNELNPCDVNDSGQIVGSYTDTSGAVVGFEYSSGKFSTFAVPFAGAIDTIPLANNDSGEIAGAWTDSSGVTHGFTLIGGSYTSFDYPGATYTGANDVNISGAIVGEYADSSGVYHGFLLSGGTYTSIDVPGANLTDATAINDSGTIAGVYCTTSECLSSSEGEQGFLLSGGTFTSFAITGEFATYIDDITNNGMVLGNYIDAAGLSVSFLAAP